MFYIPYIMYKELLPKSFIIQMFFFYNEIKTDNLFGCNIDVHHDTTRYVILMATNTILLM